MKVFEPEFQQDPEIRRRIFNWRSAALFATAAVVMPVVVTFLVEYAGCACELGAFTQASAERYWQLMLKFAAFGCLIYICGGNLIVYLRTKRECRLQHDQ